MTDELEGQLELPEDATEPQERDLTGELLDALTTMKAYAAGGTSDGDLVELFDAIREAVPLIEQLLADYTECWTMLVMLQQRIMQQREETEQAVSRIILPAAAEAGLIVP